MRVFDLVQLKFKALPRRPLLVQGGLDQLASLPLRIDLARQQPQLAQLVPDVLELGLQALHLFRRVRACTRPKADALKLTLRDATHPIFADGLNAAAVDATTKSLVADLAALCRFANREGLHHLIFAAAPDAPATQRGS